MAVNDQDIVRASVVWTHNIYGAMVNTYHLRVDVAVPPADDALVGDAIAAYMEELYDVTGVTSQMHAGNIHSDIQLFNVTQSAPMVPLGAFVVLNGGSSSQPLSAGTAALILARTAVPRKVGKKYLPVFSVGPLLNGVWDSGSMAQMNDFADFWEAPFAYLLTGITLQAVVANAAETVFTPIVAANPTPDPAYQRRRKRGRGA